MPRPDEGLIHAWLDGELEADEAARVERLVAEDADWAAAAAEARGLIAASSRILGALDVVAGDVIPKGGSAAPAYDLPRVPTPQVAPTPRASRRAASWIRIAAGLVLVAGVAYLGRGGAELAVAPVERTIEAPAENIVLTAPAAPEAASTAAQTVTTTSSPANAPLRGASAAASIEQRVDVAARDAAQAGEAEKARRDASEARDERSAQQVRRAADPTSALEVAAAISSAPTTALPAPAAPPPPASESAVNTPLAKTAAGAGVAGGAAAPRMQLRSAAPTAAALSDQAMPTAAVAAASEANLARILTGCWRTETTARIDTIQANPPITGVRGDTLLLVLKPAGTTAFVTRVGADELRGRVRDTGGRVAELRARRIACTP